MRQLFRGAGKMLWVLSALTVILDAPFGPMRLGIFPNWVFYAAVAVCVLRASPLLFELWRARRDGRQVRFRRAASLDREVDLPSIGQSDPGHVRRAVSPNER